MKWLALALVLCPLASAQDSLSDIFTGNGLYRICTESEQQAARDQYYDWSACLFYILGASEAYDAVGRINLPKVTNGQRKDIVVKYLTDHPATRQEQSTVLILRAMIEAYPPKK